MTVAQLRDALIFAMNLTDLRKGRQYQPDGLEQAIRALPDTALLSRMPREYLQFITDQLKRCDDAPKDSR